MEQTLAGIDTALWDLALRHAGVSFAESMRLSNASAHSCATVINADGLERLIPHHAELGLTFSELRIKLVEHGNNEIMEDAAAFCQDGLRIMADGSQPRRLKQAKASLHAMKHLYEYFAEEALVANSPLAEWDNLVNCEDIPFAGEERIYGIEDFATTTRAGGSALGALDLAAAVPDEILN